MGFFRRRYKVTRQVDHQLLFASNVIVYTQKNLYGPCPLFFTKFRKFALTELPEGRVKDRGLRGDLEVFLHHSLAGRPKIRFKHTVLQTSNGSWPLKRRTERLQLRLAQLHDRQFEADILRFQLLFLELGVPAPWRQLCEVFA